MGANSQYFNVVNEAELSEVLAHFSTESILSIVDYALQNRFTSGSILKLPNIVASYEQNFKYLIDYYKDQEITNRILAIREATYKEIIERICKEFSLNFTIDDQIDWYSAAFNLYDFFVSGFNAYLSTFFGNFIYKERSSIYESMNLAAYRKNKDSSTTYGKKLYKDVKLAVINANIDIVVGNISGMDIDFSTILLNTLPRANATYIGTLVSPMGDFFRQYYGAILSSPIRPVIITEIRFALQRLAVAHDGYPSQDDFPIIEPEVPESEIIEEE